MTYRDLVKTGTEILDDAQIYTGFARVLMLELLKENNQDMFQVFEDVPSDSFKNNYINLINELAKDIPLGYVLGYEWFYGYKLSVNEDVLIPRSETEELVGNVLADIDEFFESPVVWDVACGSGAIGIALSKELGLPVLSSDISEAALTVARQNAGDNNADVTFFQGDMLKPFIDRGLRCDVLVCNPPYIKNTEHIQTSVLNHEPHVALFGGSDGLRFYRDVLENAHKVLNEKAIIAFEIGFDIGDAVSSLAKSVFTDAKVECLKDINGLDRMVFVYIGINPGD